VGARTRAVLTGTVVAWGRNRDDGQNRELRSDDMTRLGQNKILAALAMARGGIGRAGCGARLARLASLH
jgi:hypothetical protein